MVNISFFFLELFSTIICDHMRAPEYYIASVKGKCSWKAFPCQSYNDFEDGKCRKCNGECPSMGYGADKTKKSGEYYLSTNSKSPFCSKYFYLVFLLDLLICADFRNFCLIVCIFLDGYIVQHFYFFFSLLLRFPNFKSVEKKFF